MREQVGDIVIETKEFMNKKYIDIRKWYHDVDSGTDKPTGKGVMMGAKNFSQILDILNANRQEIESYIGAAEKKGSGKNIAGE